MPNIDTIIQGANKQKLSKDTRDTNGERICNCRRAPCPLEGECLKKNVIYQAEVTTENSKETYVGLTSTEFKTRFSNHKCSFNDPNKKLSTELSKHVWDLKDKGEQFQIKWKILCHANPYTSASKRCDLCISEKYMIICNPNLASLNRRYELVTKCRHEFKHLIGNIT